MNALIAILALAAPAIEGPESFAEHSLAVYSAKDVPEGGAASWEVLEDSASVHECGGNLAFTGPPGRYRIVLQIDVIADGKIKKTKVRRTVEVKAKAPPAKPPELPSPPVPPLPPEKPPERRPDPSAALGRWQSGRNGCTATVIGPQRADGKWDVLCANHCLAGATKTAKMQLKDGRVLALTLSAHEASSDISWWVTDDSGLELPFALLAPDAPPAGTKIWHAGFGVDKPGNREEGTVSGPIDAKGMLPMRISVSSGDSGGGMFRADNGHLVACVCCTRARGRFADVWGGSSVRAAKLRPAAPPVVPPTSDEFEWTPIEMPGPKH